MTSDKVERIEPCLSIEEDIKYQERGWTVQQVVSYIILVLTVPIGLGLFGHGPLSEQEVQQGNITLTYERFLHQLGTTETDIRIRGTDSLTTIAFPLSYLDHFNIESVVPEPLDNRISGEELLYRFRTGSTGHVKFQLSVLSTGTYRETLRVNGTPLSFLHFTYP